MKRPFSFYIVLFVAFIDLLGIGLVYPLFSAMLFDPACSLLPADASNTTRGLWLGILIALLPLAQFFSAPILGALSDSKGRKKILKWTLSFSVIGYTIAIFGVVFSTLSLLLLSRLIIGISSGNLSIAQAAIVDLSTKEAKTKNFGLYSMAMGSGFTLGPFFGGFLSEWGYETPFGFAGILVAVNLLFVSRFFQETNYENLKKKISWRLGFSHLKKAWELKPLRVLFISSCLHNFGWSYFFEFIPVYLITQFDFSTKELGLFYAVAGLFYALSTGLLIRPFLGRFSSQKLFFAGNLLTALTLLLIPLAPTALSIFPILILMCFFVAFVTPSCNTLVSNGVSHTLQGETLGVLSSVNAFALVVSPLTSASFVGTYPILPVFAASGILGLVALYFFWTTLIKTQRR